jgi:hypothetical protein
VREQQSITVAVINRGVLGGRHEAFAIHSGSFRGCRLH